MRWFAAGTLLIGAAVALPALDGAQQQAADSFYASGYEELKPQQTELFDELITGYSEIVGQEVEPELAFQSLPISVRTTYHAVTHALFVSKLSDADGVSLGSALDRVATIETIRGKVNGARGDHQFRVYVLLKPDTLQILEKSVEFRRTGDNTVFHKGYPICFRQQGGVPSIQFSISRDGKRADIDVDYRSSKFPAALLNGHLTAANSDVRAGGNHGRHVDRWSGLSRWWRDLLLDFDLIRDLQQRASEDDADAIPAVPRAGKAKLHDAVADFLNALLVEGAANEAVAYISEEAYACWELKGMTDGKPLNRGLAPYMAMQQYEGLHKTLTDLLGNITDLKQVTEGVRLTIPGLRVIEQPYHDRFVLYDIPEEGALEWACSTRLTGEAPPNRDSKRYGKYFVAVFRVPPQRQGATVGLLLAKEQGHWKVVTFDDEVDVDYTAVPDLRTQDSEGRALKIVEADQTAVRAMRRFHREWLVTRNYSAALAAFSPAIFGCRNLYLSEGQTPARDFKEMLEGWRGGMRDVAEQLGIRQQLVGAIRSVTPTTNELAVVSHPDQDAFTIFALSDALGELAACAETQTESREASVELLRPPAEGNYYAASFEVEAPGRNPGALTTFWRKGNKGWQVYAYRVDSP